MSDDQKAGRDQPILDVHLMGNLATKMMQYLVARRLAREVPGSLISNVSLLEWGINHPVIPGEAKVNGALLPNKIDIAGIAKLLSSGEVSRFSFRSFAAWLSNFPDLDFCRILFPANQNQFPGFGPDHLVCHIEIPEDSRDPRYCLLLPVSFYEELSEATGLKLAFLGKMEENAYCHALKLRFPDATFQPSRGAMADFQTFRNSTNLVPATSLFSWLAAWLSRADMIALAVSGSFHPVQCPEFDLLPCDDERYRFYLFPINYAVGPNQFEEAHRALQGNWRYISSQAVAELRAATPRQPRRLDLYIAMFDEAFYQRTYPDVAGAVAAGAYANGQAHYAIHGFKEGHRRCFAFDEHWYSRAYPLAALEVGQGDYVDLIHHYVEVGVIRGYKPVPLQQHTDHQIGIVNDAPQRTSKVTAPRIRQTTVERRAPLGGGRQFSIGPYLQHLDMSHHNPREFVPAKKSACVKSFLAENVVFDSHTGALFQNGIHVAEIFLEAAPLRRLATDPGPTIRHPEDRTVILGANLWCGNYYHLAYSMHTVYVLGPEAMR